MYVGILAVIKHYEKLNYTGTLKFSISETSGIRNIDMCEDTTIKMPDCVNNIDSLRDICLRMNFGMILVYLNKGKSAGYDYKINYQGETYSRLERECMGCRPAKIVVKKLSS